MKSHVSKYTLPPVCHIVLSTLHILSQLDLRDTAFMHNIELNEVKEAAKILEAKGYIRITETTAKLTRAGSMACGQKGYWIVLDTQHNIKDYGFTELYPTIYFAPYTKLLYREIRPFKKTFIAVGKSHQLREIWLKKKGYYTPLKYFHKAQSAFIEAVNYTRLGLQKQAENTLKITIKYLHYTQQALQKTQPQPPQITIQDITEELEKTWQKLKQIEQTLKQHKLLQ